MCCGYTPLFRGRSIRWVKWFIVFSIPASSIFQGISFALNSCNPVIIDDMTCTQWLLIAAMAAFGLLAFVLLTLIFYRQFLKRFLARRFPIGCGHRKCIFTGESSRTLREILQTIDRELPSDETCQDFKDKSLHFLDDVRREFEKHMNLQTTMEYLFVGSLAERYGIPYTYKSVKISKFIGALHTDMDVMICLNHEASFSGRGNLLIQPLITENEGFLGFAHLKFTTNENVISSKDVLKTAEYAIGRTKVANLATTFCFGKCATLGGELKYSAKGPAINVSTRNGEVDFDVTSCIKCGEWPPISDWPTRQRCWPSQDDVTRIVAHGCHLVAKPAPSDKEQTSWRFSFSVAEVELSKLVPKTARKCLLALKIILKDHLQPVAPVTSYKLKTVFLNTLEKTPVEFWVDENIEECFLFLLKEFHDALVFGRCIHHWFRSINLFGRFYDPEQISVLIKKLEIIAKNPAPFIFDDGCCCLSPCCTRRHLYDFPYEPGRTPRNLDRYNEIVRVECVNEQVDDGSSDAAAAVRAPELDPENQTSSLASVSHKQVLSNTSGQSVVITGLKNDDGGYPENQTSSLASVSHKQVLSNTFGQSVVITGLKNDDGGYHGDYDDCDDGDGNDCQNELHPILNHSSYLSKYGAINV